MSQQQNIARIRAVYNALGSMAPDVVFVGGATVSLYADRPTSEVRATEDVDIVVELAHYTDYTILEDQLRQKGFVNDTESGVICRFRLNGIMVDIMPTSLDVLGFSNRWYPFGFASSITYFLDQHLPIRIFSPACFIASKLEAFQHRGEGDGRLSTDFEDIVFLLNNCSQIWDAMSSAPLDLREYLQMEWKTLLANDYFDEWISAHLDHNEQRRITFIKGGLHMFISQ